MTLLRLSWPTLVSPWALQVRLGGGDRCLEAVHGVGGVLSTSECRMLF